MCISDTSYVLYYSPFGEKVHRIFYNFCVIFNYLVIFTDAAVSFPKYLFSLKCA